MRERWDVIDCSCRSLGWDGENGERKRKVSSPAYVGKKQIKPEGDPDLSERLNMLTRLNGIDEGGNMEP